MKCILNEIVLKYIEIFYICICGNDQVTPDGLSNSRRTGNDINAKAEARRVLVDVERVKT